MASPVKRRATYEDLLQVPDHQVAEIVDGDMHVSPRPASRHALAASGVDRALGPPFHDRHGGPGGWWILFEPELHLGEDVPCPTSWGGGARGCRSSRTRRPSPCHPTGRARWCPRAPSAWIAPGSCRPTPGSAHVWLVNPLARTLEVYRRAEERWLLVATLEGNARVRAEPFGAVELALGPLWGEADRA